MPHMMSLGKEMPCCPGPSVAYKQDDKEMHYPTVYIDADDMDLGDLPMEGKAVIKYKIVRDTKTVSSGKDGKKKHRSIEMEIREIGTLEEEEYEGDNLDKLKMELVGE